MHEVFLSLGSNLGDRMACLNKAAGLITSFAGSIIKVSSVYETEPWGCSHNNNVYNMALELETSLKPMELLKRLQKIEKQCGRKSSDVRYAARTLDIDILFYDNEMIETDHLKIPHPLIHERRFVLFPMVEIAPLFVHPVLAKTISQLLANCGDEKKVVKLVYRDDRFR